MLAGNELSIAQSETGLRFWQESKKAGCDVPNSTQLLEASLRGTLWCRSIYSWCVNY